MRQQHQQVCSVAVHHLMPIPDKSSKTKTKHNCMPALSPFHLDNSSSRDHPLELQQEQPEGLQVERRCSGRAQRMRIVLQKPLVNDTARLQTNNRRSSCGREGKHLQLHRKNPKEPDGMGRAWSEIARRCDGAARRQKVWFVVLELSCGV